jgi:hypothetical protein
MASLRKKYYSLSKNTWIDINTSIGNLNNSRDVVAAGNMPEKLRLIGFDTDFSSSNLMDLIADLVYNDIITMNEATKVGSILSDGVFKNVGNEFAIEVLDTQLGPGGTRYITKFLIKDGLINKTNSTTRKTTNTIVKRFKLIQGNSSITTTEDVRDLSVGMLIKHPLFVVGTQIVSIDIPTRTVVVSSVAITTTDVADLVFSDEGVFYVGTGSFDAIVNNTGTLDHPPIFRRDLIEIGQDGSYNILRGIETTIIPPVHTVLDSYYNIDSITYVSGNIFKVNLSTRIARNFESEFYVGQNIKLLKTFDGKLDNVDYNVVAIGTNSDQWIQVEIPGIQGSENNQTQKVGFVDSGKLGLYSVVISKNSSTDPNLIGSGIETVFSSVGIVSGVQEIYRAKLVKDEFNIFSIKTKERVHLTDVEGRWLDYSSGQSVDVVPSIGFSHNTENLTNEDLDNTQLPQSFDAINISSLANIPFIFNNIQDNIFNQQSFSLDSIFLGVKNDIENIGDEGIEIQIVQPQLALNGSFILTPVQISEISSNFDCTIVFQSIDFSSLNGAVAVGDVLYVTYGPGQYQSARITSITGSTLNVNGFTKELDSNSSFVIFKNNFNILANSNMYISSANLKSQVISGVNGRFGNNSAYSKVKFKFSTSPVVLKNTWYFIRVKGKNEGITWGNLPYITTEFPSGTGTTTRNAFVEVNYKILNGTYGIDRNFHLEDSFGDLNELYPARAYEPHFCPQKYTLIAKPVTAESQHPSSPEIVYVDVTGGKFLFHPKGEPIELFAYYHKYNVISGESTDFSLRHIDPNSTKQINIQDKINELSGIFRDGTNFERPITVNGILNKTTNGFRGPVEVREDDPYRLEFKEEEFNNHAVSRENYKVRANKSQDFSIIKLESNAVVLDESLNVSEIFFDDKAIQDTTLKLIPTPALDEENRLIVPSSETANAYSLKIKSWNRLASPSLFEPDNVIVDSTTGVKNHDGSWNDFHSYPYGNKNVLKFLIRKKFFEGLDYPAQIENKKYWKQREVLKNVTDLLNNYSGSTSQIVSEKYLTLQKNDIEGTEQDGEYFVVPYTETTKYSKFSVVPSLKENLQNITDFSGVTNTIKFCDSTILTVQNNTVTEKHYFNLVTDPNSAITTDRPVIYGSKIIKEVTELDYNEMSYFTSFVSPTLISVGASGTKEMLTGKILDYSPTLFVVAIGYQDDDSLYKIDLIWYEKNSSTLVEKNRYTISDNGTDPISSQIFVNAIVVAPFTLVVSYKKSTKSVFRIVNYDPFVNIGTNFTVSDPFTFSTSSIVEPATLQKFSRNSFLIFHSDNVGTAVKKYDIYGNAEFFDEQTVDEIVLTTNTPIEGAGVQTIELADNNIFLLWQESATVSGISYRDTYIAIFDEWYKIKDQTQTELSQKIKNKKKISSVPTSSKFYDWSLSKLNDDITLVSKRGSTISITPYQINGLENPNGLEYPIPSGNDWKNLQVLPITTNGFIWNYNDYTNYKITRSVYEYRPDFLNPIREISKTNNLFTISSAVNPRVLLNYNLGNNKTLFVIHSSTQATAQTRMYLVDNSVSKEFRILDQKIVAGITDGTTVAFSADIVKDTDQKFLILYVQIGASLKARLYNISNNLLTEFQISGSNETEIFTTCKTNTRCFEIAKISENRSAIFVSNATDVLHFALVKGEALFDPTPDFSSIFGAIAISTITCNPGKMSPYAIDESNYLLMKQNGGTTNLIKIKFENSWGNLGETPEIINNSNWESQLFDFASADLKKNIRPYSDSTSTDLFILSGLKVAGGTNRYFVSWEVLQPVAFLATVADPLIYVENFATFKVTTTTSYSSIDRSSVKIVRTPTGVTSDWVKKSARMMSETQYQVLEAAQTAGTVRNLVGRSDASTVFSTIIKAPKTTATWTWFESFGVSSYTANGLGGFYGSYAVDTATLEDSNYPNSNNFSLADTTKVQHQVVEVTKSAIKTQVQIPSFVRNATKIATADTLQMSSVGINDLFLLNGTKVVLYWDQTITTSGISENTEYFVVQSGGQTFKLSTDLGGSAISFTMPTSTVVQVQPLELPITISSNTFTFNPLTYLALFIGQEVEYLNSSNVSLGVGFLTSSSQNVFGISTAPYGTNITLTAGSYRIKPFWNITVPEQILSAYNSETVAIVGHNFNNTTTPTTTVSFVMNKSFPVGTQIVLPGNKSYFVTSTPTGSGTSWTTPVAYYGTVSGTEFDDNYYSTAFVGLRTNTAEFKLVDSDFSSNLVIGNVIKYTGTNGTTQVFAITDRTFASGQYTYTVAGMTFDAGASVSLQVLLTKRVAKVVTTVSGGLKFESSDSLTTTLMDGSVGVTAKQIEYYDPINNFITIRDIKNIPTGSITIQMPASWTASANGFVSNILTEKVITKTGHSQVQISTSFFGNDTIMLSYLVPTGVEIKELEVLGLNTPLNQDRVYSTKEIDSQVWKDTTYFSSGIKLSGNNYRGKVLETFPLYAINNNNVLNQDGMCSSSIGLVPINVFKKDLNNFSVVYQPLDSQQNNAFLLRDFVIINNRIFVDSNFYQPPIFSFPNDELYSKNLQVVKMEKNLFYAWKQKTGSGDEVRIAFVDNTNNMINGTYKTVNFVESVFVESRVGNILTIPKLGPMRVGKTIRYNNSTTMIQNIEFDSLSGKWKVTVNNAVLLPSDSGFMVDLSFIIGSVEPNKNKRDIEILGAKKLIEDYVVVLIHDKLADIYYTPIFDSKLNQVSSAKWFSIDKFNRTTDLVSSPTIDDFGNFYWYYKNQNSSDLRYFTHGIDGDLFGVIQMVGKI